MNYPGPPPPEVLGLPGRDRGERILMKRFRFQLLAGWIESNFEPCRVADVGGGKGVLAHLLNGVGFDCTVIDPRRQDLPRKVRPLEEGPALPTRPASPPRYLQRPFAASMGTAFDLVVGMHAHGSNLEILRGVGEHGYRAVLMPCCVIDEPSLPPPGESWFMWLVGRGEALGLHRTYFQLPFRGQNIGVVWSEASTSPPTSGQLAERRLHR